MVTNDDHEAVQGALDLTLSLRDITVIICIEF